MARSIGFLNLTRQEIPAHKRKARPYRAGMEIKEWIKAAREAAEMTQEDLGEALSRTKGNVSGWEKGLHEPSFSQILRISVVTRQSLSPGPAAAGFGDASTRDVTRHRENATRQERVFFRSFGSETLDV